MFEKKTASAAATIAATATIDRIRHETAMAGGPVARVLLLLWLYYF